MNEFGFVICLMVGLIRICGSVGVATVAVALSALRFSSHVFCHCHQSVAETIERLFVFCCSNLKVDSPQHIFVAAQIHRRVPLGNMHPDSECMYF